MSLLVFYSAPRGFFPGTPVSHLLLQQRGNVVRGISIGAFYVVRRMLHTLISLSANQSRYFSEGAEMQCQAGGAVTSGSEFR